MSRMHNPPHPGGLLKEFIFPELNLNVKEVAEILNVDRSGLSSVVNGNRAISPKLAIKIEKAFGCSAELLLNMQAAYDLWQTEQAYTPDDVKTVCAKTTFAPLHA